MNTEHQEQLSKLSDTNIRKSQLPVPQQEDLQH